MADTQATDLSSGQQVPVPDGPPTGMVRVWDSETGQAMDVDEATAHSLLRAERFKDHDPALDQPEGQAQPDNTTGQAGSTVVTAGSASSTNQGQAVAPAASSSGSEAGTNALGRSQSQPPSTLPVQPPVQPTAQAEQAQGQQAAQAQAQAQPQNQVRPNPGES